VAQAGADIVGVLDCVLTKAEAGEAAAQIALECGLQAGSDVISLLARVDRHAAAKYACVRDAGVQ
jgi:hypothetical protein